ncbi:MAG: four helix bundle protein [Verrucomicrobiota bacterium]
MHDEPLRSFEDLECWQACRALRVFVRGKVVPLLPKEEIYRLTDQLIRASRSTTANIAEGYGRFHYLDNAKFCSNSRGSVWEILDHLITANDENLIETSLLTEGRALISTAVKLTNGYISYLRRAAKENAEPHPHLPNNQ